MIYTQASNVILGNIKPAIRVENLPVVKNEKEDHNQIDLSQYNLNQEDKEFIEIILKQLADKDTIFHHLPKQNEYINFFIKSDSVQGRGCNLIIKNKSSRVIIKRYSSFRKHKKYNIPYSVFFDAISEKNKHKSIVNRIEEHANRITANDILSHNFIYTHKTQRSTDYKAEDGYYYRLRITKKNNKYQLLFISDKMYAIVLEIDNDILKQAFHLEDKKDNLGDKNIIHSKSTILNEMFHLK